MPTLAIVIVSWNTRDLLHRSIQTIHASLAGSGIDYKIVVVDNASSDGTPAMLRAEHPEVVLLESGRNLGFAGGNNLALRRVLGSGFRVLSSKVPQTPNSKLQTPTPTTSCCSTPTPRSSATPSRSWCATWRRIPMSPWSARSCCTPTAARSHRGAAFRPRATFFWESTPLEPRWPGNPWARRYRCADTPDDAEQEVGWLVGAALLVRRAAIERAGLLDAGFQCTRRSWSGSGGSRGLGVGRWAG